MRKFLAQMHLDMFRVIGFEGALVRLVKMHEHGHHLTGTYLACALSLLACGQLAGPPLRSKAQPKIIDITKHFE
jgi:hypothetical protein